MFPPNSQKISASAARLLGCFQSLWVTILTLAILVSMLIIPLPLVIEIYWSTRVRGDLSAYHETTSLISFIRKPSPTRLVEHSPQQALSKDI